MHHLYLLKLFFQLSCTFSANDAVFSAFREFIRPASLFFRPSANLFVLLPSFSVRPRIYSSCFPFFPSVREFIRPASLFFRPSANLFVLLPFLKRHTFLFLTNQKAGI
ncbi:hypothetical protein ABE28_006135 [Peribacillus muralis]|uniref:Secreted protein n=1 Tax=Peribacillus muralis TaxID=264697 RepID=A0A1B3XL23_9BACI|nr:hypothetical protein ABE28_006135 [Peribacillus muralis]